MRFDRLSILGESSGKASTAATDSDYEEMCLAKARIVFNGYRSLQRVDCGALTNHVEDFEDCSPRNHRQLY